MNHCPFSRNCDFTQTGENDCSGLEMPGTVFVCMWLACVGKSGCDALILSIWWGCSMFSQKSVWSVDSACSSSAGTVEPGTQWGGSYNSYTQCQAQSWLSGPGMSSDPTTDTNYSRSLWSCHQCFRKKQPYCMFPLFVSNTRLVLSLTCFWQVAGFLVVAVECGWQLFLIHCDMKWVKNKGWNQEVFGSRMHLTVLVMQF